MVIKLTLVFNTLVRVNTSSIFKARFHGRSDMLGRACTSIGISSCFFSVACANSSPSWYCFFSSSCCGVRSPSGSVPSVRFHALMDFGQACSSCQSKTGTISYKEQVSRRMLTELAFASRAQPLP